MTRIILFYFLNELGTILAQILYRWGGGNGAFCVIAILYSFLEIYGGFENQIMVSYYCDFPHLITRILLDFHFPDVREKWMGMQASGWHIVIISQTDLATVMSKTTDNPISLRSSCVTCQNCPLRLTILIFFRHRKGDNIYFLAEAWMKFQYKISILN